MCTVYEKAKAERINRKMSQRELASTLGISQTLITGFENGKKIGEDSLNSILNYFGLNQDNGPVTDSCLYRKSILYRQIGRDIDIYRSTKNLSMEEFSSIIGTNTSTLGMITVGSYNLDRDSINIFEKIKEYDKTFYNRIHSMFINKNYEKYNNTFYLTKTEKANINTEINNLIQCVDLKLNYINGRKIYTNIKRTIDKIKTNTFDWFDYNFYNSSFNNRKICLNMVREKDENVYNHIISILPWYRDDYLTIDPEETYTTPIDKLTIKRETRKKEKIDKFIKAEEKIRNKEGEINTPTDKVQSSNIEFKETEAKSITGVFNEVYQRAKKLNKPCGASYLEPCITNNTDYEISSFVRRYRCKCGKLYGKLNYGITCTICKEKVKYIDNDSEDNNTYPENDVDMDNKEPENTGWMEKMANAFKGIDEPKEKISEEDRIAKENIDLLRFDYIHNKIMGLLNSDISIDKKEWNVIKKEISLCDFDTRILEIKLSRLKIKEDN